MPVFCIGSEKYDTRYDMTDVSQSPRREDADPPVMSTTKDRKTRQPEDKSRKWIVQDNLHGMNKVPVSGHRHKTKSKTGDKPIAPSPLERDIENWNNT